MSRGLHFVNIGSFKAGFARTIVSIRSIIRDSMLVIRHISANLVNSITIIITLSGIDYLNITRLRHTH
jgi:hypothetical protein